MIDIGANLTDKRFHADLPEVIDRAKATGLEHIIVTGTSINSARSAQLLCDKYPEYLSCTVGVHPHDASHFEERDYAVLKELAQHPAVVAIGETGLDYNRNFSPAKAQRFAFEQQIQLAVETQLPLFLHEREAEKDLIDTINPYLSQLKGAVVHCFTGDKTTLYHYLDMGLYIGITGWVCDERRGLPLLELVTKIPDDRILLETDAPYLLPRNLSPKPKKGRNEPSFLPHVAATIANVKGISTQSLIDKATQNTRLLFNL